MRAIINHLSGRISLGKLCLPLLGLLIIQPLVMTDEAAARSRRHSGDEGSPKKQQVEVPPGPLFAVVSITRQRVSIYGNTGLVASAPISTGQPGHPTPTGLFSILGKERFHRSNLYSSAPMPWMQRVTWSGIAMHQGVLPGYPASHGCIRMPTEFARRLFSMTKVGQRVVITRQDVDPAEFTSARLPAPKLQPAPVAENQHATATQHDSGAPVAESLAVQVKAEVAGTRMLNPIELASTMRKQIAAKAEAAAKALKAARAAAGDKADDANDAVGLQKRADAAMAKAAVRVAALNRRIERAKSASAKEDAQDDLPDAEKDLTAATGRALAAYEKKAALESDEFVKALRQAEATSKELTAAVKEWNRRTEPVSIFISRKTGRLYVRQAFNKVFDTPVTIRDAGQPIGTHLYVATSAEADASKMRWQALSIPDATPDRDTHVRRSGIRKSREDLLPPPPEVPLPTAAEALERIEIPGEASARISEMLWTGATLIVSDHGTSSETGEFTDFIISTR